MEIFLRPLYVGANLCPGGKISATTPPYFRFEFISTETEGGEAK
jgi:hypothetical protein